MSDELTTQQHSGPLATAKYADDKAFTDIANSSGFLPRLQLYAINSEVVAAGKIQGGAFGIVTRKDNITPIGKSVNCYPLVWRFKAVRFTDDGVINKYNPNDPEFIKIKQDASVPNARGVMAGVEFLLYIPETEQFVTYFMSNKSALAEAPNLRGLLEKGSAATIKSEFTKNKKGAFYVPLVTACSMPLDMYDVEEAKALSHKFANPKETEVEQASEAEQASNARPQ